MPTASRVTRRVSPARLTLLVLLHAAAALACLRRWGAADPWARLTFFSLAAVASSAAMGAQQGAFTARLPRDEQVRVEAFGAAYDPGLFWRVGLLGAAELLTFVDYAHWRLVPALEHPLLQAFGLAVQIGAMLWLRATDRLLVAHFADPAAGFVARGPFAVVRHPRYLSLILSKAGLALMLASAIGWVLAAGWIAVVVRRISREEPHLRARFGRAYEEYARRTKRLLPGVY
jgi:protein-S-isoprenylcysteine O-methyltransferase Ste14